MSTDLQPAAEALDAPPPLSIDEVYDRIDRLGEEIAAAELLIDNRAKQIAELHTQAARLVAAREERLHSGTVSALTPMERRVSAYLRSPMTAGEIARELWISVNTVKTHMKNIYSKLGAKTRAEAVAKLVEGARLPAPEADKDAPEADA